jgi:hypothetical protein
MLKIWCNINDKNIKTKTNIPRADQESANRWQLAQYQGNQPKNIFSTGFLLMKQQAQ